MKINCLRPFAAAKTILVAAFAVMLASCSNNNGKDLELIPADSYMVAKFNPEQVIRNTGCSVENGQIALSQSLNRLIAENGIPQAIVNEGLSYTAGFDYSSAYLFCREYKGRQSVCFFMNLTDPDKVKTNIDNIAGEGRKEGSYTVYDLHPGVIAIDGNKFWGASSLNEIKDAVTSAASNPITLIPEACDFLTVNSDAMNLCFSVKKAKGLNLPSQFNNYWGYANAKLVGPKFTGELYLADAEGKRFEVTDAFDPIDTDVLAAVPVNDNISVFAMGNPKGEIRKLFNNGAQQLEDQFKSLLTGIDGTMLAAVEPNELTKMLTADTDPETVIYNLMKYIDLIFAVHYTDADSIISDITDAFMLRGKAVTTVRPDLYSSRADGNDVFFGKAAGSYVAFANFPFEAQNPVNGTIKNFLEGKLVGIVGVQAPGTNAEYGIEFGSNGVLALEKDRIMCELNLTGTNEGIFEALINLLSNEKFMNYLMNSMSQQMSGMSQYAYDDLEWDADWDSSYDF